MRCRWYVPSIHIICQYHIILTNVDHDSRQKTNRPPTHRPTPRNRPQPSLKQILLQQPKPKPPKRSPTLLRIALSPAPPPPPPPSCSPSLGRWTWSRCGRRRRRERRRPHRREHAHPGRGWWNTGRSGRFRTDVPSESVLFYVCELGEAG